MKTAMFIWHRAQPEKTIGIIDQAYYGKRTYTEIDINHIYLFIHGYLDEECAKWHFYLTRDIDPLQRLKPTADRSRAVRKVLRTLRGAAGTPRPF